MSRTWRFWKHTEFLNLNWYICNETNEIYFCSVEFGGLKKAMEYQRRHNER